MPRPKRTKVASMSTTARRVENPDGDPEPLQTRHSQTPTILNDTKELSDDSQGLVKIMPWARGKKRSEEYTMTGGLGEGDVRDAHRGLNEKSKIQRRPNQTRAAKRPGPKKVAQSEGHTKALDALKKRRDAAKGIVAPATEIANAAVSPIAAAAASPANAVRPRSTPRAAKGLPADRTSERVTNTVPAGQRRGRQAQSNNEGSSPQPVAAPRSALKVQGTPGGDTSILALANFKRRPRQPSLLRMVQQTSDDELSDFDDFNPDDESTPLQLHPTVTPGAARSAKSDEARTSSSRKRKLSSPLVQVRQSEEPRSSPPLPDDHSEESDQSNLPSDGASSPQRIPDTQQSQDIEQRHPSPEIWSETMAPPKSSSPTQNTQNQQDEQNAMNPTRRRGHHPRQTQQQDPPLTHDADSDASDASQASPAQQRRSTRRKRPTTAPALSTKTLQALLPRRRPRSHRPTHRAEYDLPSSPLQASHSAISSDEDELQAARPSRRGAAARKPLAKAPPTRAGRKTAPAATTAPTKEKPQARASRHPAPAPETSKPIRTYSRRERVSSDKENDALRPDDDEDGDFEDGDGADRTADSDATITIMEAVSRSAELAAAARKFSEVDQWEMEFESVDLTGGSSSPWR